MTVFSYVAGHFDRTHGWLSEVTCNAGEAILRRHNRKRQRKEQHDHNHA